MTDYISTRSGLLVPTAAFAETAEKTTALEAEVASIDKDPNKVFFGNVLRNEDDTLLTRGGGKGLKIYDELERDAHAYSVLQKRKLAVVARPVVVTQATDSDLDKKAAAFISETLAGLQFDRICIDLLDAVNKGFSVGEIMWTVKPSAALGHDVVVPSDVIARDQRRFVFGKQRDEAIGGYPLRLLTRTNLVEGELLPDRKFIVHRFGAKDGSPYGLGLGNKLFWPVFFKRQDIGFWLTFADKFGAPTAIGKYPRGAQPAEQTKLLQALRAIASDVGIVVPEGTEVDLLEAARSGSIDTYEKLARYMDEQMSVCVLGETNTTTAQSSGLGSGQANVHNEVRKEISQADADLLTDSLKPFIAWLIDYNMPGAGAPKVSRDFSEEEDLNKRAERDKRIYDMGFDPTEQYITETYGVGWKKSTAPRQVPGTVPPGGPAFAEGESGQRTANRVSQEAIAQAAEQLSAEWQRLIGPRIEDIVSMAEQSGDLVEFRAQLTALLDKEPPKELVDALSRAGFVAQLAGRSDRA